jgi:ABC-2 type transport system ATP-binding protein
MSKPGVQERMTAFLTTTNLMEAEAICDLIGVLYRGRLISVTTPQDLHRLMALRVQIRGRGFTPNLVALLRRRADVASVCANSSGLCIHLSPTAGSTTRDAIDAAPLVTLLIESGAEVEEVHKQMISLAEFCLTLEVQG